MGVELLCSGPRPTAAQDGPKTSGEGALVSPGSAIVEEPRTLAERFTVGLVADGDGPPAAIRLRRWLKEGLRTHGLRCDGVAGVPDRPTAGMAVTNAPGKWRKIRQVSKAAADRAARERIHREYGTHGLTDAERAEMDELLAPLPVANDYRQQRRLAELLERSRAAAACKPRGRPAARPTGIRATAGQGTATTEGRR
jgi:hypothetical protein